MVRSEGPAPAVLGSRDKLVIAAQGALRAVPYVGSSLEHFMFGHLNELRMKRMENTLNEVAQALGKERSRGMATEKFVNLLEFVTPDLSRSTDENKRTRFRDLLRHAAEMPQNDAEWDEAQLAAGLLKEIDPPGLAVLACLHALPVGSTGTLASRPSPQVCSGELDYENPGVAQHPVPYSWVVVEYWARWLRDRRLITFTSYDARGGFGGVALAELGRFLITWTMADQE